MMINMMTKDHSCREDTQGVKQSLSESGPRLPPTEATRPPVERLAQPSKVSIPPLARCSRMKWMTPKGEEDNDGRRESLTTRWLRRGLIFLTKEVALLLRPLVVLLCCIALLNGPHPPPLAEAAPAACRQRPLGTL